MAQPSSPSQNVHTKLADALSDLPFASAVVAFAEHLRQSPYTASMSLELVEELALASARGRDDRLELVGLIQQAKQLKRM